MFGLCCFILPDIASIVLETYYFDVGVNKKEILKLYLGV